MTRTPLKQRGVVYIEVLMSFLPLLLAFLGICQLAILRASQLVVQHAATRAARAAIVVLEDDPDEYDGAPRGDLTEGSSEEDDSLLPIDFEASGVDAEAATASLLEATGTAGLGAQEPPDEAANGGARYRAIVSAAYHPLAALAPSLEGVLDSTLEAELAKGGYLRILLGRLVYVPGAAAVSLRAPGSTEPLTHVGPRDQVTVHVAFVLPCAVPLVSSLMCTSNGALLGSALGISLDERADAILEETKAVESPALRTAIFTLFPRLTLLTADATMPNQGAKYYVEGK